jgi:hypothetical protein
VKDDLYDDVGPGATLAIADFNHNNDGIIGGGALCNEFTAMPYLFSKMRPPGAKRWGVEHKEYQRSQYKKLSGCTVHSRRYQILRHAYRSIQK